VHSGVKPLSFDCCAMSLAPFETPVCTKEGVVFDILNVMPYVKKHKRNPITGEHNHRVKLSYNLKPSKPSNCDAMRLLSLSVSLAVQAVFITMHQEVCLMVQYLLE
jgi:hypothetical protein